MKDAPKNTQGEKQKVLSREEQEQEQHQPPPPYMGQPNYYPSGMPGGMAPPGQTNFWAYPAIPTPASYDGQSPSIPIHSRPPGMSIKPEYPVEKLRPGQQAPAPPPKPYFQQHPQPAPQPAPPPAYFGGPRPPAGLYNAESYSRAPHPSALRGNYTQSASRITLDDTHDLLIAECSTVSGETKLSAFRLDLCLTNADGCFRWVVPGRETGNFGASARNTRLVDGGRWLEAELCRLDGRWQWDRICLDERIENSNGLLRKI